MSWKSWLASLHATLFGRGRVHSVGLRRHSPLLRYVPHLESLEDRLAPVVTVAYFSSNGELFLYVPDPAVQMSVSTVGTQVTISVTNDTVTTPFNLSAPYFAPATPTSTVSILTAPPAPLGGVAPTPLVIKEIDIQLYGAGDALNFGVNQGVNKNGALVNNVNITTNASGEQVTLNSINIGGTLTVGGGGANVTPQIMVSSFNTITTGGDINLTGTGTAGTGNPGISLNFVDTLNAGGKITANGIGDGVGSGIYAYDAFLTAGTGAITLAGTAGSSAAGSTNQGVLLNFGSLTGGAGGIAITGIGAGGSGGVSITTITLSDPTGAVSIAGIAGSNDTTNPGVLINIGAVNFTGSGFSITGSGTGTNSGTNSGVSITGGTFTASGAIMVSGTAGSSAGTGTAGVLTNGGQFYSSGSGVTINGTGGGASSGVSITGGGAGALGAIMVMGTAGSNAGTSTQGVFLSSTNLNSDVSGSSGSGVTVTGTGAGASGGVSIANGFVSASGAVTLTGTAGSNAGSTNQGVLLTGVAFSASASGSANGISLTGIGAGASGGISITGGALSDNGPTSITGSGAGAGIGAVVNGSINAGTGNITIIGTGAGTSDGVDLGANVTTSNNGTVTIKGSGGGMGVNINASQVTTLSGAITITGTGNTTDLQILGAGALIQASGTQNSNGVPTSITLTGTDGKGAATAGIIIGGGVRVVTNGGAISLTGTATGTSTGVSIAGTLDGTLNGTAVNVSANISVTGNAAGTNGALSVAGDGINITGVVQTNGAGTVTLKGTGGSNGVNINGGQVTSVDGNISISGTGSATGVTVQSSAGKVNASGNGAVSITGSGGNATYSPRANEGVLINAATVSAGAGGITINATANGVGPNLFGTIEDGLDLSGATVSATSTGTITIKGTASTAIGTVVSSDGVRILGGLISTVDGNLAITGTGGVGTNGGNDGISIQSLVSTSAQIKASGVGSVSLTGAGGNGASNNNAGIFLSASTVSASAGGITLSGAGNGTGSNEFGVDMENAAIVTTVPTVIGTTNLGPISFSKCTGSVNGIDNNVGVFISGTGTKVTTQDGPLSITGTGGGAGLISPTSHIGQKNVGVEITSSGLVQTSEGAVALTGAGGNGGGNDNHGVFIHNSAQVSAGDGGLTITGTGNGAGEEERGVDIESSVSTSGFGPIAIKAAGSVIGDSHNQGVYIGSSAQVSTAYGAISITGTGNGTGSANAGIDVETSAKVTSANAVSLTGAGGNGAGNNNSGVFINGGTVSTGAGGITIGGAGNGTGSLEYGVDLESGAQVNASQNGSITIKGTGGAIGQEDNSGVRLNSGAGSAAESEITTNSGPLSIIGTGGGTDGGSIGIDIEGGSMVQAETEITEPAGPISLTGSGGTGAGSGNEGVFISGSTVSGGAGGIAITGTGNGFGNEEIGVDIESSQQTEIEEDHSVTTYTGAQVSATGTGPVTIKGAGGPLGDDHNPGVYINGSAGSGTQTMVTTQLGALNISGTGGGMGEDNYGMDIRSGAEIEALSVSNQPTGPVSLSGTGGNGETDSSGFYMITGAVVSAGTGGVTITGTGIGRGDNEFGVDIENNTDVLVTQTGALTIKGTGSALATNYSSGVFINVVAAGGQVTTQGSNPEVYTQLGALSITGTGGGSGAGQYNMGIALSADVEAQQGGPVSLSGTGGNASGQGNEGVFITGGTLSGGSGGLSITGTGNGTGSIARGVNIEGGTQVSVAENTSGGVVDTNGTITIKGTGSALGTSDSTGVYINAVSASVPTQVTTSRGALSISGTGGGTTSGNMGVDMDNASIKATAGGALSISGTGGAGTQQNYGVYLVGSGTTVTTTFGALGVSGTGGNGTGDNNVGVDIETGAQVSTGRGPIAISGTGGGSGNYEDGVDLVNGTKVFTTQNGTITIKGTGGVGGTNNNIGVFLSAIDTAGTAVSGNSPMVTTATGGITIQATGGGFGQNNYGLDIQANAQVTSITGTITLQGTAGGGDGINNIGVVLLGMNTIISTAAPGTVTIAGTGGSGAGPDADGVLIAGANVSQPNSIKGTVLGTDPADRLVINQTTDLTPIAAAITPNATYTAQPYNQGAVTVAGLNLLPASDFSPPVPLSVATLQMIIHNLNLLPTPSAKLEGVPGTFAYFDPTGLPLASAPTNANLPGQTYSAVGSFPGSLDYAPINGAISPVALRTPFSILPANPTFSITDNGGIYNANPYPVTAVTAIGVDGSTLASLSTDAIALSFTYYSVDASNNVTSLGATAPTHAELPGGHYQVVAKYTSDNTNYATTSSQPFVFQITQATPTITAITSVTPNAGQYVITASALFAAQSTITGANAADTLALQSGLHVSYFETTTNNPALPFATSPPAPANSIVATKSDQYFVTASFSGNRDYTAINQTSSLLIQPGTAQSFVITGPNTPVTAGTPFSVTLLPKDSFGNNTSYSGTVSVTLPTGFTDVFLLGPYSVTVTNNVTPGNADSSNTALLSSLRLSVATPSATIATATTLTFKGNTPTATGTASITVNPGPFDHLAVTSTVPSNPMAGIPFTLTVAAEDFYNNTLTSLAAPNSVLTGAATITDSGNAAGGTAVFTPSTGTFTGGVLTLNMKLNTVTTSAQTLTISAGVSSGTTPTVTTSGIAVTPGPLDHFAVAVTTPSNPSSLAGGSYTVQVTAQDAFNNTLLAFPAGVTFNTGAPLIPTPSKNGGVATYVFPASATANGTTFTASGPTTLTVSATDSNGTHTGSANFTVNPAAPATVNVVPAVTNNATTAGAFFNVQLKVFDAYGNPSSITSASATLNITPLGGTPTLVSVTAVNFSAGVVTLTNVQLAQASTSAQMLTATVTPSGTTSTVSGTASITVSPGIATKIVLTPTSATEPDFGAFSLTATAYDGFVSTGNPNGNIATGTTGTVTIASTNLDISSATSGIFQAGQGIATINGVILNKVSSAAQPITATFGTFTSISNITVVPAKFGVSVTSGLTNGAVTAGQTIGVTVTALDAKGGLVLPGFSGNVPLSDSLGGISTTLMANFNNASTASVVSVIPTKAGSQTITATLGTITGTTLTPFTVNAGPTNRIVLDPTQSQPFAALGTTLVHPPPTATSPFTFFVDLLDLNNNPVPNTVATITDSLTGTISPTTATSNSNGVVTISMTSLPVSTTSVQQIMVKANNATYTTPNLMVDPVFAVSSPGAITAGSPFKVTITAQDTVGNTLTNITGAIRLTSTDPLAPNLGVYTFTAADRGVLTISGLLLKTAGSQTLTATGGPFTGSGTIVVTPTAVAKLVARSVPTTATAGTPFKVDVFAEDRFGNTVTTYNRTAILRDSRLGSLLTPTTGAFQGGVLTLTGVTLTKAGSQAITIASGGFTFTTPSIAVSAGVPGSFVVRGPSAIAVGAPFSVTVTAKDAYGNTVTNFTGTVTVTSTDPLAPSLGTFEFTAPEKGVLSIKGLVLKTRKTVILTATFDSGNSVALGSLSILV